jgi:hypothetical protein
MVPILVALGSLVLALCAALGGMALRHALPALHDNDAFNNTVTRSLTLVVSLTSLVLGFMVGSAKGYYDGVQDKLTRVAADAMVLDRGLAHYGPEAREARELLRQTLGSAVRGLWPRHKTQLPGIAVGGAVDGLERLENAIRALPAQDDEQRSLRSEALQSTRDIMQASSLFVTATQNRFQQPILAILALWLVIIFLCFGILAPRNGSAIAVLLMSAVAISGAVFLIQELYNPMSGLLQIPPSTLELTLERIPSHER